MNIDHYIALGISLGVYLILSISFYGWGRLLIRIVVGNTGQHSATRHVSYIWLGWALTLLLFQILHLFFPIRYFVTFPVYMLGLIIGGIEIVRELRHEQLHRKIILLLFGIPFCLFAIWLASRAMLAVNHYDAGLYYLSSIRWTNAYSIVPGLGNLHGRLAFNQSLFVYVASLNVYPLFMNARSLGNSFLLLLGIGTCFEFAGSKFKQLHDFRKLLQGSGLLCGLCALIFIWLSFASNGLSSSAPDLASSILQIIMFIYYFKILDRHGSDAGLDYTDFLVLSLLAVTSVTVKLSNVAFGGAMFIVCAFLYMPQLLRKKAYAVAVVVLCGIVLIVHATRGYILSGAPFYPSTLGYIDFDWAMPRNAIAEDARWVYSWARAPFENVDSVLGNWHWLGSWSGRILRMHTRMIYPVAGFVFTTLIGLGLICFRGGDAKLLIGRYFRLILPMISGLTFWFITAPDPRFAEGVFLLILVAGCLFLSSAVQSLHKSSTVFMAVSFLIVFLGGGHLFHWILTHKWVVKRVSTTGWHDNLRAEFSERVTDSGLRVYVPVNDDRAWDGPLPGTPNFNPSLRLRRDGCMSSGFTVAPHMSGAVSPVD